MTSGKTIKIWGEIMARGIVDIEGLNQPDVVALRNTLTPKGLPFSINKIGHVVLKVQNIEK